MGKFADGSTIRSDRKVCLQDGSPDPQGRWIDQAGYVRLADGGYEDDWYVDGKGVLYDGDGRQQGESLGVPSGWQVSSPVPGRKVEQDETLWTTAGGQKVKLSTTGANKPSQATLDKFKQAILKTARAHDAMGGDLSWAGGDFDPKAMHGRAIGAEYVGEDTRSNAFRAETARAGRDAGDASWTTLYGASGDATRHKSVQEATVTPQSADEGNVQGGGLLVDPSGKPLDGTFGYVVAADGTLYTFNRQEAFVTVNGEWKDVSNSGEQLAGLILEAMKNGEQARQVHHSTPVRGQPVAGAGDIQVSAGKITKISNDSGHYQPEAEYLWQTMEWLAAQGMPVKDIDVRTVATTHNAEEVLKAWKFRLSGGNVAQVRAKDKAMDELLGTARQKATSQLAPDDLKRVHQDETGCPSLTVQGAGDTLYCGACDKDLDEKYRALLAG